MGPESSWNYSGDIWAAAAQVLSRLLFLVLFLPHEWSRLYNAHTCSFESSLPLTHHHNTLIAHPKLTLQYINHIVYEHCLKNCRIFSKKYVPQSARMCTKGGQITVWAIPKNIFFLWWGSPKPHRAEQSWCWNDDPQIALCLFWNLWAASDRLLQRAEKKCVNKSDPCHWLR